MKLAALLLIGLGGGVGAICRGWLAQAFRGELPLATLIVNVLGAAILGLLFAWEAHAPDRVPNGTRELLAVGFCGGFTTFSTFSLDTLKLIQAGQMIHAFANILLSVSLSLLAVWLGWKLGRTLFA